MRGLDDVRDCQYLSEERRFKLRGLQKSIWYMSAPTSTIYTLPGKMNGVTSGKVMRYGPNFTYDEFLQMPSKLSAFTLSVGMMAVAVCLVALKPVSTSFFIFKGSEYMTSIGTLAIQTPGQSTGRGTLGRDNANGFIRVTNVTTAVPAPANPPSASTSTTNGDITSGREPKVVKSQFITNHSSLVKAAHGTFSPQ
ncbi:hypothetical protein PTI98_009099 [Pleurotus ostreatus]|nr:hypothetical protein PTI98_009099 [Pleurotus ostreatus]